MIGFARPEVLWSVPVLAAVATAAVFLVRRGAVGRRTAEVSPGGGGTAPIIWRALAAALLLVALALPFLGERAEGIRTVFILDDSDSISDAAFARGLELIRAASENQTEYGEVGVVLFGRQPMVVTTPSDSVSRRQAVLDNLSNREGLQTDRTASDPAAAVRTGISLMGDRGSRHVIVLTDGALPSDAARDSTLEAVAAARRSGILVSAVQLGTRDGWTGASDPTDRDGSTDALQGAAPTGGEVRIADLLAPTSGQPGDRLEIAVQLESTVNTSGTLYLYRNEELLGTQELTIPAGRSIHRYFDVLPEGGFHRYRAELTADRDRFRRNNGYATVVQTDTDVAVLYLTGGSEPRPFADVLQAQGVDVDVWTAGGGGSLPETLLSDLLRYRAVVLDNIPSDRLSLKQMENMEKFVRETGGGLIMLGGDHSFGAGRYAETPLEETLPVTMDVTSSVQIPSLVLLFVVDKSGSMEASGGGGASKLRIVQEAVLSSLELMYPSQRVGLLSFDADVEWTVPIMPSGRRDEIVPSVRLLESGGGTMMDKALAEALAAFEGQQSGRKHIVVLSDGKTREADFAELTDRIRGAGITISTVSIGPDAERELMEMIARRGAGRSYHTADVGAIPRIFSQETGLVARDVVVREAFFPTGRGDEQIFAGIDIETLPALDGFVTTYPKATANQILDAPDGHPLFATWQYGLGRAAAFTGSIDTTLGPAWSRWDQLPRFAGQLVRWVGGEQSAGGLSVEVTPKQSWAGESRSSPQVSLSQGAGQSAPQLGLSQGAGQSGRPVPADDAPADHPQVGTPIGPGLSIAGTPNGPGLSIAADLLTGAGLYDTDGHLWANVIGPAGSSTRVPLVQTVPGRYQGWYGTDGGDRPGEPGDTSGPSVGAGTGTAEAGPTGGRSAPVQELSAGTYVVTVYGDNGTGMQVAATTVTVWPYPAEYRDIRPDPVFLRRLARTGGGVYVPSTTRQPPSTSPTNQQTAGTERTPLWRLFVILSVLVFVSEIAYSILRPRFLRSNRGPNQSPSG